MSRYGTTLSLNLSLRDSRLYELAALAQAQTRAHQLWQQTCFEIFIKDSNATEYIEINLAPNGNWNAYYFLDTRRSFIDDGLFEILPMAAPQISAGSGYEEGLYKYNALIELPEQYAFLKTVGSRLAMAAVVKGHDQHLHYMALHHPTDRPDFHHPQSFTLRI